MFPVCVANYNFLYTNVCVISHMIDAGVGLLSSFCHYERASVGRYVLLRYRDASRRPYDTSKSFFINIT